MTGVVGFSESDWPSARSAINQVLRGGTEHPFHRARWPVGEDAGGVLLMKYTSTGTALGPRNSGGIQWEGNGLNFDYTITGGSAPSVPVTVTVNGRWCKGIILPNQLFWARYANSKYWAIEGAQCLTGLVAADGPTGTANVTFTYDGSADADIECVDPCGDVLVEGSTVVVSVCQDADLGGGCTLQVVRQCCPPV